MKLVQLDISAIRASDSQNNAYVLLLNELIGERQLPIVIGWCEARSIAIALDGTEEPERPLTHDLFKTFSEAHKITVSKVVIHTLNEGIFHACFYCKNHKGEEIEIDARTSDAIAIAIRFACPIFTYEDILKRAGIIVNTIASTKRNEKEEEKENEEVNTEKMAAYSLQELKKMLKESVEEENYERASELRDEINKRMK